jgi:type I restriction enzyme, S subunit
MRVVSGGTPSRASPEYFLGGTIPWMKTGEVKKCFVYETEEHITELGLENSSAKLIPANSLIVAMYGDGDTAGNVAVNKVPLTTNQACCNFIVDPKKADYLFLYYYLKGSYSNLVSLKLGGSQQNLNAATLKRFPVPAIALPEQHKIAAVLSAYDDLIANNQRRIALLESMAEEVYREWFVRMRFPGCAQVAIEKGVPHGWQLPPTAQAFSFYGGATPSKDVARFWQGGAVHWYTPTDITGAAGLFMEASSEQCTEEGLENCSAKLFPAHSIMMTSRATIGAIGINLAPACTNQGFITCIPNDRYPLSYLYHWLKLAKPHFESLSGGATFAELTKGTFKRIRILTPPKAIVNAFDQRVAPMFKQMELLIRTNSRLKATRDALLPRLISGKLKVDHLDIQLPRSMQDKVTA